MCVLCHDMINYIVGQTKDGCLEEYDYLSNGYNNYWCMPNKLLECPKHEVI